jgi:hypothetical protein
MRYQPTDLADRSHVGDRWTKYQLRSLQIILQATHGVVSGAPEFFKRAFGDTVGEFEALLLRPHHFIFNRDWYEKHQGRSEFTEYASCAAKLSEVDRRELLKLLSSCDPREYGGLRGHAESSRVEEILEFYKPLPKSEEARIWALQKACADSAVAPVGPPEEEFVEDAGLSDDDGREAHATQPASKKAKRELVKA